MKKILTILFSFSIFISSAQVPGVTKLSGQSGATVRSFISGAYATPAASAILEGRSTTKGFLEPRLTTAQMLAISAPADGLQVFNIDSGKPYYYFDSVWYQIGAPSTLRAARVGYGSGTNTLTGDTGLRYIPGGTPTLYVGTLQACGSDGYYGGAVKSGIYEGVRYDITNNLADSCDGSVALQYPFGAQTVFAFPNNPSADDSGQFLHNIGNGITRWDNLGNYAWGLTGNAGTDTSNFIGTTGAATLFFRQNNYNAGRIEGDATYNTAIGFASFDGGTGFLNSAFGVGALGSSPSGSNNTAMGISSLGSLTTGENNTAFGSYAGVNISSGSHNTMIGDTSAVYSSNAMFATAIGNGTRAASYSTALGTDAHAPSEHSIVIGDTTDTALMVGIGTQTPTAKLHVLGNFQLVDGTQGAGKVLTSDANGLSAWQAASTAPLDSASIYALTPTLGAQYYCTDCTGNGITGRIVAYIGAAWRRLLFED